MEEFQLESEYIELIKLLKLVGIAESGGAAKQLVEEGLVFCNDKVESRKRLKVRKGDTIRVNENSVKVV